MSIGVVDGELDGDVLDDGEVDVAGDEPGFVWFIGAGEVEDVPGVCVEDDVPGVCVEVPGAPGDGTVPLGWVEGAGAPDGGEVWAMAMPAAARPARAAAAKVRREDSCCFMMISKGLKKCPGLKPWRAPGRAGRAFARGCA